MLHVHTIDSLDLPELAPYRTMKRPVEHQRQGLFVAEGEKVVRRLLQSRFTVVSLLLHEKWLKQIEPLLRARAEEIHAYVADHAMLEQLTGFPLYQGLLAIGRIPARMAWEDILAGCARPYLFAALDGINNSENLGVLVRNCGAFGVQALIVGETSCSPFLRRAVRNSMGVIFELPVTEVDHLVATLERLRQQGVCCVAAHPRRDQRTLAKTDLTRDVCLVFGSEGHGLSAAVLAACDEAVAIPMQPGVDSLNVATASAVFFYEVNRQRGKM
jgi:tRNA G18 (ribose-2'-O)-methylase SpoU